MRAGDVILAILADNADAAIVVLEARADIHLVFTVSTCWLDERIETCRLRPGSMATDTHIITTGNARPREVPANALIIPKPYLGPT